MSDLIFYDNKKIYSLKYAPFEQKEVFMIIKYFSDISCMYNSHFSDNGSTMLNIPGGHICVSCVKDKMWLKDLIGCDGSLFVYKFLPKHVRFYFYKFEDSYMSLEVMCPYNGKFEYDGYMIDSIDGLKYMLEKIKEWLLSNKNNKL